MTDNDKMPFGKHRGERMEDVPASYLHWIWTKDGFDQSSPVGEYIRDNMSFLMADHPDGIWE